MKPLMRRVSVAVAATVLLLGVVGRGLAGGTGRHLSFGGLINGSRDVEPFVGEVLNIAVIPD